MKRKPVLLIVLLLLALSLTACAKKMDLPMEVTVDGYTIVLGKTTMKDMTDLGYEVHTDGMPDVAREGDKYIPFYYSLDRGAGDQIHVTVMAPWSGNSDISAEQSFAVTEGVIRSVRFTLDAVEKVEVTYNGMNVNDLNFEYAKEEWGAKLDDQSSTKIKYQVDAKNGFVILDSISVMEQEYGGLNIQLTTSAFEKMQEQS